MVKATIEVPEERLDRAIRLIVKSEMANQGLLSFIREVGKDEVSKETQRYLISIRKINSRLVNLEKRIKKLEEQNGKKSV